MNVESFIGLPEAIVPRVAELLRAELRQADYLLQGAAVQALRLHSAELGLNVLLVIWPSVARVDVRLGRSALVFKRIDTTELYPGLEVLFRRHNPAAYLGISVHGRVLLST